MAWFVPKVALHTIRVHQCQTDDLPPDKREPTQEDAVIAGIFSDNIEVNNPSNTQITPLECQNLTGRVTVSKVSGTTDDKVKHRQPLTSIKTETEGVLAIQRPQDIKKVAMLEKSGGIWECIDEIEDLNGGHIYKFVLRRDIDPLQKLNNPETAKNKMYQELEKMFPAVEPTPYEVYIMLNNKITKEEYLQCEAERKVQYAKEEFDSIFCNFENIYEKQHNFEQYLTENNFPNACLDLIKNAFEDFNSLDEYKAKLSEMLPILANPDSYPDDIHTKSDLAKHAEFFNKLGFNSYKDSEGRYVLTLPDVQALQARWDQIMKENTDLPRIKILVAKSIASDEDFVKACLRYDVLVSSGTESIHDLIYHVASLISRILSCVDGKRDEMYLEEKERLNELLGKAYQKIMFVKQKNGKVNQYTTASEEDLMLLLKTLGAATDSAGAARTLRKTKQVDEKYIKDMVDIIWSQPPWMGYLERCLPGVVLDRGNLSCLWGEIWNVELPEETNKGQA